MRTFQVGAIGRRGGGGIYVAIQPQPPSNMRKESKWQEKHHPLMLTIVGGNPSGYMKHAFGCSSNRLKSKWLYTLCPLKNPTPRMDEGGRIRGGRRGGRRGGGYKGGGIRRRWRQLLRRCCTLMSDPPKGASAQRSPLCTHRPFPHNSTCCTELLRCRHNAGILGVPTTNKIEFGKRVKAEGIYRQ